MCEWYGARELVLLEFLLRHALLACETDGWPHSNLKFDSDIYYSRQAAISLFSSYFRHCETQETDLTDTSSSLEISLTLIIDHSYSDSATVTKDGFSADGRDSKLCSPEYWGTALPITPAIGTISRGNNQMVATSV